MEREIEREIERDMEIKRVRKRGNGRIEEMKKCRIWKWRKYFSKLWNVKLDCRV
jgi:hypothetical protein